MDLLWFTLCQIISDPVLLNARWEKSCRKTHCPGQQESLYLQRHGSILVKQFICQCFELYIDKYTIVVTSTATSTQLQAVLKHSFAVLCRRFFFFSWQNKEQLPLHILNRFMLLILLVQQHTMTVNSGTEQEWKKGDKKPNDISDAHPFTQHYRGWCCRDISGQTAISLFLAATEKIESVLGMSWNHIAEFIAGNVQQ